MYYFIFRLGQTPLHGIYNLQSSFKMHWFQKAIRTSKHIFNVKLIVNSMNSKLLLQNYMV